jgi:hypothetical protein
LFATLADRAIEKALAIVIGIAAIVWGTLLVLRAAS